jgi:POT family proton-dependent oligopeptide transporter
MFKNQPKGLYALALANTGERFGYYTMIAVFALFLRANFGLDAGGCDLQYIPRSCLFYAPYRRYHGR